MTKPKKTPRQLAEEHWMWLEGIMLESMRMHKRLFEDAFIHGHGHGKEDNTITIKGPKKHVVVKAFEKGE